MRLATAVAIVVVLAGCSVFPGAAERRAREATRLLITAPDDQARLASVALLPSGQTAEVLVRGIGAQVALSFLRAKHRQGGRLDFSVISTASQDDRHKTVVVAVSPRGAAALQRQRTLLRLQLEDVTERGWLVTGVEAGD